MGTDEAMTVGSLLLQIVHWFGSAVPLTILCFMIVFIARGKKVKANTVISYIVVAVIMFIILLRTN